MKRRSARIIPFRRRRGHEAFTEILERNERRHRAPLMTRVQGRFARLRPWLLLGVLLVLYALSNPGIVPPRGPLVAEREVIDDRFERCRGSRSSACVIDGDTIRVRNQTIRLVGFNTPEYDAHCERERVLAEQATIAVHKLLNDGPVALIQDRRDTVDRYGRALRSAMLIRSDGREVDLADEMIALGLAEPYRGGTKRDWC